MSKLRKGVLVVLASMLLSVSLPMNMVTMGGFTEYQPAWGKTYHANISNGENPQVMFFIEAGDNITITISNYTGDHNGTIGLSNLDFGFYYELSGNWQFDGSNRLFFETKQLKQTDVLQVWIVVVYDTRHYISGFLDSGGPSTPIGGFDWNISRSKSSDSWDAEIQATLNKLTLITNGILSNQTNLTMDFQNLSGQLLEISSIISSINNSQQSLWDEIVALWDNGTSYQTQMDAMNSILNTISGTINELWGNLSALWGNISSCIQIQNDLLDKYVTLSLDIQSNNQSIHMLENEINTIQSNIDGILDSMAVIISELQASIAEMDTSIAELWDIINELPTNDDIGLLEIEITSMKSELLKMNSTIEGIINEIAKISNDTYLPRITLLESQVLAIERIIDDLAANLSRVEDKVTTPYNDTLIIERMKKIEDENAQLKNQLQIINGTLKDSSKDDNDIYIVTAIILGTIGVILGAVALLLKSSDRKRKMG